MEAGGFKGRLHVGRHGPGDVAAHVLQHEGDVGGREQAGPPPGGSDLLVSQHIGVGRPPQHLEGASQRRMVVDDRQPAALSQLGVALDVPFLQRILETAGDTVFRDVLQQLEHVVVGAVHGDVVVDAEPLGGHFLHGVHLVHHVLEGREMVLHPCVAHGRKVLDGLRHALGMGRDRPGGHRHPAAVALPEELVDGDSCRLAHQVVHGRPQSQRVLVSHPVEGAGADVFFDGLLGLRASALAQSGQPGVGMHHVDGPFPGTVEVVELIGDPVHELLGDVVDLDVGDPDGSMPGLGLLFGRPHRLPAVQEKGGANARKKTAAG